MNQFDRLEKLAQRLVEGTFQRIFHDSNEAASPPVDPATPADTTKVLRLQANRDEARQWVLWHADDPIELGDPVVNLGRALDNDIVLNDPTVSRYHAQLRWREGRYFLCPPDPQAVAAAGPNTATRRTLPHTTLNGETVGPEPMPLAAGDTLNFGKTALMVGVQPGDV